MRRRTVQWVALLLALVLAGCGAAEPAISLREEILAPLITYSETESAPAPIQREDPYSGDEWVMTPYSQMEYTRPDVEAMAAIVDEIPSFIGDKDRIIDAAERFYSAYTGFYTSLYLADIRASADLTDAYWANEYSYCLSLDPQISQLMETMHEQLAGSPCRKALEKEYFGKDFFSAYDNESFWDDTMLELAARENALISLYYDQQDPRYEIGSAAFYYHCAEDMTQTLVELIRVRQKIAAYAGYASYPEYAFANLYTRDYTVADTQQLIERIRTGISPLYPEYYWLSESSTPCTEEEMLSFLKSVVQNVGDTPEEAFQLMEEAGLFDIAYSPNKYNSSFEIYLDSYQEPFLFLNPTGTRYDCLTLSHEFGHFCRDYASWGSMSSIDVQEFFSQGMEYLSLFYGANADDLRTVKLADSLCTYVEQAVLARFELEMYNLSGNDLSMAGLCTLFETVNRSFGMTTANFDRRDYVTITHFYTNPMYLVSYIVSNDAAMQIYELEQKDPGSGLAKYLELLTSDDDDFLRFVENGGLQSPFRTDRMDQLWSLFRKNL